MKEFIKGILNDFLYRIEAGDCETVDEFMEDYLNVDFEGMEE